MRNMIILFFCRFGPLRSFLLCLPLLITFSDLADKNLEGQQVQIRGFAYQTPSGAWILASQPNLKSCCLDPVNKKQQIILENVKESLPKDRVTTISGVLKIDKNKKDIEFIKIEVEK